MNVPGTSEPSGLREYAALLWARKITMLVVLAVFVGGTLAYSVISTHKYTATSELLLTPTLSPTLLEANGSLAQIQTVDVPSDSTIIESNVIKQLVERTIPNAPDAAVVQVGTTNVVKISATSTSATTAAAAASAYARAYIKYEQDQTLTTLTNGTDLLTKHLSNVQLAIASLNAKISATTNSGSAAGLETQLQSLNQEQAALEQELANYEFFSSNGGGTQSGQIISFASVPTKPSSPKTLEWTIIAAIAGIIVGVGLAMLLEALADPARRRS
jgi:uncharacterized protein involved in exopolysaccharide biosynthesis